MAKAKKATKKKIDTSKLKKGAFTKYCKSKGYSGVTTECISQGKKSKNKRTRKQAVLAENFRKMRKRKKK